MNDTEREFRLGDAFFAQLRRTTITRLLPMMVLAAGGGLVVARARNEMSLGTTVAVSCFLLAVVGVSIWNTHRVQVKRLHTFRIVTTPAGIQRAQDGLKPLFIHANDIGRIVSTQGKGVTVHGGTPNQAIFIPETIDNFGQLRDIIGSWCSIDQRAPAQLAGGGSAIAGVATVAGFVIVFWSSSVALVVPVGLALIALFGWSIVSVSRSPHIDARVKRLIWLVAIPIASIAARVWSMLRGGPVGD